MKRGASIVAATVLLGLGLAAGVFAFDVGRQSGRISRNVEAAGVDLSAMSAEEAREALQQYEAEFLTPIELGVDSERVVVDPGALGVQIDVAAIVGNAYAVGRTGSAIDRFSDWVVSWFSNVSIDVGVGYDADALRGLLDELERTVVDRPPFHGAVELAGDRVVPLPPIPGAMLEIDASTALLAGALQSSRRVPFRLPLVTVPTLLSAEDVEAAASRANALVDTPVYIRDPRGIGQATITTDVLRSALRSEIVVNSPAVLDVWLDESIIRSRITSHAPQFETEPVSGWFEFDEEAGVFTVQPSVDGTTIDAEAAARMVVAAAASGSPVVAPIVTGELPEYSTEALEAMNMTKVSEFTTHHSCCEARVTNIHLMADAIDGTVVWPGETFSINEHVGQRTFAKGYRKAGAIIGGKVTCCDSSINIGGGTSQFGTTFYNAVFYSCYEDVEHQPHSIYFSRYPRGREATLSYPKPDVVFRNDTATPVWIDTSYTASSITVTFYGDNEGRVCTDEVKGRNPITVTRVIAYPDGSIVRQPFTWRYRSFS